MKCLILYTTDIKELDKFNDIDTLIIYYEYSKNFDIDKLNKYISSRPNISQIYSYYNDIKLTREAKRICHDDFKETEYKLLTSCCYNSDYKYEIKIIDFDNCSISSFSDDKIMEYYKLDKLDRYKIKISNKTLYSDNVEKLSIENEKLKSEIAILKQNKIDNIKYKTYPLLSNKLFINHLPIITIKFEISEIESDNTIIIIDKDSFNIKYTDAYNEQIINNCISYNCDEINKEIEKYIKNLKEKINNTNNILEIKIPEKLCVDIVSDEDNVIIPTIQKDKNNTLAFNLAAIYTIQEDEK